MTTDTKAVVRYRAVLSHGLIEVEANPSGSFVLFTDHERIVEEIGLLWTRELVKRDDALAASRAEVEGLKKDAERYRWLQKQTPYRLGKIQANCVIDAVDTLYFMADEFDQRVDEAIGANA